MKKIFAATAVVALLGVAACGKPADTAANVAADATNSVANVAADATNTVAAAGADATNAVTNVVH